MSGGERIRPFADADLGGVTRLWEECGLARPWNPPARDIAFCIASGHGALFVAEGDGGTIVGSVMVGHDGHRGWLYYVAVEPARQRGGLGRRLVGAAEAWLEERGVGKAMLLVRASNTAVCGFYESLGYGVEDRVLMARWLKQDRTAG